MTLSRSLDMETTLAEVGRLLVPRFADWCSVQLLRDGQLETGRVAAPGPGDHRVGALDDGRLPDPDGRPHRRRQRRPHRRERDLPLHPRRARRGAAVNEEHLAILRRLGLTSAIVAPLVGRDGVVGAVTLIHAESGRRYSEEDLAFLEEVADRVALALDTAATFEQQSERLAGVTLVAEAAQRAILAPPPARIGPVALSARYLSAAVEAQVGGDLYEVVRGPSSVRLLVGDVAARDSPRCAPRRWCSASSAPPPPATGDVAHVAREIDRRIRAYLPDAEDFVTGVLVDIEHDGHFSVVSCGHPAPVLLTSRGRRGGGAGPLTAARARGRPGRRARRAGPGRPAAALHRRADRGTIARRRLHRPRAVPARVGRGRLRLRTGRTARPRSGRPPATPSATTSRCCWPATTPRPRRCGRPSRSRRSSTADPANVGRARRLLRTALEGVGDTPVDAAELLLSEVVTNAFVHAGGVVKVHVRASPAGVRVEVEDRSSHHPVRRWFAPTAGTGPRAAAAGRARRPLGLPPATPRRQGGVVRAGHATARGRGGAGRAHHATSPLTRPSW